MARTESSVARAPVTRASSVHMARLMALRSLGRLKITVAIGPSRRVKMSGLSLSVMAHLGAHISGVQHHDCTWQRWALPARRSFGVTGRCPHNTRMGVSSPRKVRSHVILLVLSSLLPVLAFAIIMAVLFESQQRASVESNLGDAARALTVAVDREL